RREEHAEAIRVKFRREVAEREEGARHEDGGANPGSEELEARDPRLVERTLQVAAVEGLFRQGDREQLGKRIVADDAEARRRERRFGFPKTEPPDPESRKDEHGDPE